MKKTKANHSFSHKGRALVLGIILLPFYAFAQTQVPEEIPREELANSEMSPSQPSQGPAEVPSNNEEPSGEADMGTCGEIANFKQKQCCYRAEAIKDLQRQEFKLPGNPDEENLFDLQKEYDQELAELKVLEGVHELQEDYFQFMDKLSSSTTEENSSLAPLKRFAELQETMREGMDTTFKLSFLHDAMEEMKTMGVSLEDAQGNPIPAENIYDQTKSRCIDNNRENDLCALLNPNSTFNQSRSRGQRVKADEMKDMIANYMRSYVISQEGLSREEKIVNHQQYEEALSKIPQELLRKQTALYDEKEKEIDEIFDRENEDTQLGEFYKCVEQVRYGVKEDCSSNISSNEINALYSELVTVSSTKNHEILEEVFNHNISPSEKSIVNDSLAKKITENQSESLELNRESASLTQNDQEDFDRIFESVESKLKIAARVSEQRAAESIDDFLKKSVESDDEKNEQFEVKLMNKLCKNSPNNFERKNSPKNFERKNILECLKETSKSDKMSNDQLLKNARNRVKSKERQIAQIMDSPEYKRINSFKNYYAHESQKECGDDADTAGALSFTGDCLVNYESEGQAVKRLVDDADKVVAEVRFNSNGGVERSIDELLQIHEFCVNLPKEEREEGQFSHECSVASTSYNEATADHSELSDEFKDYVDNNISVYDPETGEVSYEKPKSTWGMVGRHSARSLVSSLPTFMQYQHTKAQIPFLRDRAMFQKTQQHWMAQQFNPSFYRPGLNPFASGMGFGGAGGYYNVSSSFGQFGFGQSGGQGQRMSIDQPQGFSIP